MPNWWGSSTTIFLSLQPSLTGGNNERTGYFWAYIYSHRKIQLRYLILPKDQGWRVPPHLKKIFNSIFLFFLHSSCMQGQVHTAKNLKRRKWLWKAFLGPSSSRILQSQASEFLLLPFYSLRIPILCNFLEILFVRMYTVLDRYLCPRRSKTQEAKKEGEHLTQDSKYGSPDSGGQFFFKKKKNSKTPGSSCC